MTNKKDLHLYLSEYTYKNTFTQNKFSKSVSFEIILNWFLYRERIFLPRQSSCNVYTDVHV